MRLRLLWRCRQEGNESKDFHNGEKRGCRQPENWVQSLDKERYLRSRDDGNNRTCIVAPWAGLREWFTTRAHGSYRTDVRTELITGLVKRYATCTERHFPNVDSWWRIFDETVTGTGNRMGVGVGVTGNDWCWSQLTWSGKGNKLFKLE